MCEVLKIDLTQTIIKKNFITHQKLLLLNINRCILTKTNTNYEAETKTNLSICTILYH
jgi:hypothetical protein